jgi:hypothetical protein
VCPSWQIPWDSQKLEYLLAWGFNLDTLHVEHAHVSLLWITALRIFGRWRLGECERPFVAGLRGCVLGADYCDMGMRRPSVENRGPFLSKLVRFPWETRPADLVGVESLTERLDVAVEARFARI